ncbi:MAG: ATP-binding protein [Armatimonadota bacterium]
MSIRELIARLVEERRVAPSSPSSSEEPEARLAIYDSPLAAPQVISLRGDDFHSLVGELAARTYAVSRERGGRVPFIVIREIMENLIHAYFRNATITVLDDGNTIRIADGGPGIGDKARALLPGFSTATEAMRRFIRGVGSGLPVAQEQMQFLGGTLTIEDNLERGTVVTMSARRDAGPLAPSAPEPAARRHPEVTARQKKVLLLIAELGAAGPTMIAKELDISHSTAYRELQGLQTLNLVTGKGRGKRTLTEEGIAYLDEVFKP